MFNSHPDFPNELSRQSGLAFWKTSVLLETPTRIFIALNFMDLFMTFFLLHRGGFHESNQIAEYFLDRWGIVGMIWFKIVFMTMVVIIAQVVARQRLNSARFLLYFGCIVVGGVVVYSGLLYLGYNSPVSTSSGLPGTG